jgi:hypothetical protein
MDFFCAGHMPSLTYLSTIHKYYSTSSTSSYVCTHQHVGNSQKRHDIDGAKNGTRKADVAECQAEIFQHVSDMSSDTSMLHQNCQCPHPTNPTKGRGGSRFGGERHERERFCCFLSGAMSREPCCAPRHPSPLKTGKTIDKMMTTIDSPVAY